MNEFLNLLNENIGAIVALFGSSSAIVAISSVVKSFSQKKLNKSFEDFTNKTNLSNFINNKLLDRVDKLMLEFMHVFEGFKLIKEYIEEIDFERLFKEISKNENKIKNINELIERISDKTTYYEDIIEKIFIKIKQDRGEGGLIEWSSIN